MFEATCEVCFSAVPLTAAEEKVRIGSGGEFCCDRCKPRAGRRRRPSSSREDGCIVTAMLPGGELRSWHRAGLTLRALAEIAALLPEGSVVLSISTPHTIRRDLHGPRRLASGRDFDPYSAERSLLGRIGRTDLLPASAAPLFDRVNARRR